MSVRACARARASVSECTGESYSLERVSGDENGHLRPLQMKREGKEEVSLLSVKAISSEHLVCCRTSFVFKRTTATRPH